MAIANPSTTTIVPGPETPAELADCALIDVRTPGEFRRVHAVGAINLPLDQLDRDGAEAIAAGRPIVLICHSGARTMTAADRLAKAGLTGCRIVAGGTAAWDRAGLPVERGRGTIPLDRQVQLTIGLALLASLALAYFVDPAWTAVAVVVGCGLTMAGLTGFCPLGLVMRLMPWNRGGTSATCCGTRP